MNYIFIELQDEVSIKENDRQCCDQNLEILPTIKCFFVKEVHLFYVQGQETHFKVKYGKSKAAALVKVLKINIAKGLVSEGRV